MLCDLDRQTLARPGSSSDVHGVSWCVILTFLLLSNLIHSHIGLGLLTLVTYVRCEGFLREGACGGQSNVFNQGMYYVVATSVNVTATTLICFRLLQMKRKLASTARLPGSFGGGGPYGRISMILIESALPFTIVGVLCSILAFVGPDPPWFFVSRLWTMASVSSVFTAWCLPRLTCLV